MFDYLMKHVETSESAERSGILLAMNGREFRVADGEIARRHGKAKPRPIGSAFVSIHDAMRRAIHGF